MMTRRIGMSLSAVLPLLGTGCIGLLGPLDLQLAVGRAQGIQLHREMGINVGGVMLGLAGAFVVPSISMSDLSGVDVGIYEVAASDGKRWVLDGLELPGFEAIVRMREGDTETLILLKEKGDSVRQMVVLARDGRELVIVRVKGRIDAFLAKAVKQGTIKKEGWKGLAGAVTIN